MNFQRDIAGNSTQPMPVLLMPAKKNNNDPQAVDISTNRLRELRRAAGMTQEELAEKLDTTYQNISLYERGAREMPGRVVRKVTRFFRVTPNELLGIPLTDDQEGELLVEFRKLSDLDKAAAISIIKTLNARA
jgi:transcriptional regulator with XRE-family HTH domain